MCVCVCVCVCVIKLFSYVESDEINWELELDFVQGGSLEYGVPCNLQLHCFTIKHIVNLKYIQLV